MISIGWAEGWRGGIHGLNFPAVFQSDSWIAAAATGKHALVFDIGALVDGSDTVEGRLIGVEHIQINGTANARHFPAIVVLPNGPAGPIPRS